MKKYFLADLLTFSRFLISIFLILLGILGGPVSIGFLLFLLAEITDAFDGSFSRKWPFPKGKEPAYRKNAVKYDMIADIVLWFAAVLFFSLRISMVVGLIILFSTAAICLAVEIVVYGKLFGHPDDYKPNSLCDKDFNLAKDLIMKRRKFYLFTVMTISILLLAGADWSDGLKILFLILGFISSAFFKAYLSERSQYVSRDAIALEKKMLQAKKSKK